jgi:CelD/BcsL family acetyltransferase involved in cellulose biosynthesis
LTAAVEVHEDVTAIPDWDELMRACGAPVFYGSGFLTAYRKAELLPADAYAYLLVRDANRAPRAALPVTLLPRMDPAGLLSVYEPALAARPQGLISHAWHCYDTWLPTRRGEHDLEAVAAVLDAFGDLAADFEAPWYGLVNVEAAGPLAGSLTRLGAHGLPIDERYVLDLPRGYGVDDYLAGLTGKHRATMRAQQRRAAQAGASVRVLAPADADLDAHFRLVELLGSRRGVAHYYPRGGFQDFQLGLGDAARIIEVRVGERLVGVGVCLLDAQRLHVWACGIDYAQAQTFSPFYVLFYEALRLATALGVSRFECGRRNGVFKRRYGMRPVSLLAFVAPAGRPLWGPRRSAGA